MALGDPTPPSTSKAIIARPRILVKYWRIESIGAAAIEKELKVIRFAIKQRYPTYPIDVEHHAASADSAYDQDVDLHYNNNKFFDTKYNYLIAALPYAPEPK